MNNNNSSEALACLCVTDAGNAYAQVLSTSVPLSRSRSILPLVEKPQPTGLPCISG